MPKRRLLAAVMAASPLAIAAGEPPRLTGIVITAEQRVAMFAAADGRATMAAEIGEAVGAEQVLAIEPDGVRLAGPTGSRTLTLGEDGATRVAFASESPLPPLIDPYRREREFENDQ